MNLHYTTEASFWVKEWIKAVKENPNMPLDEITMLNWFSTALTVGYKKGYEEGFSKEDTSF